MAKTAVTRSVYRFIKDYIKQYERPPTLREIAEGCYISPSAVTRHLERLEDEGKLTRMPEIARGIKLIDDD